MAEPMEGHPVDGDAIAEQSIQVIDVDETVLQDCRSAGESLFCYLNFY